MCKLLYKVIWLKYKNTEDESDWLSILELVHTSEVVFNFYLVYSNKPSVVATTRPMSNSSTSGKSQRVDI